MERIIVDDEKVLELLERGVEARGANWVYPDTNGCKYVYEPGDHTEEEIERWPSRQAMVDEFDGVRQPACFVGWVLVEMNPRLLDWMYEMNNETDVDNLIGEAQRITVDDVVYEFTDGAKARLSAAQRAQDIGNSWGVALEKARAVDLTDDEED